MYSFCDKNIYTFHKYTYLFYLFSFSSLLFIIILTNDVFFFRGIQCIHAPWHCFPLHSSTEVKSYSSLMKITDLTAPQILLLRKLSLLKLTALMEKYSSTSKTGWSWAVPKFIRRIRNPDYKGLCIKCLI